MSTFAEIVREALDLAYDPPSEAHSALDALEAQIDELNALAVKLQNEAEEQHTRAEAAETGLTQLQEAIERLGFSILRGDFVRRDGSHSPIYLLPPA